MTNKTSNPTIWQALPLSLTAPRFTSMASGRERKKPLMAYFNEPLSNICTAAWNGNTAQRTSFFLKLSTLLFLFVTASRPKTQIILLCPFLVFAHCTPLIEAQSSGIHLCYVKTVSGIFKWLCSGNLREWVYHRSTSLCKCSSCSKSLLPQAEWVSGQVLLYCIFHCLTVMQHHFVYITSTFIVVCQGPKPQLFCVPRSYCAYWLNEPWKQGTAQIILGSSHLGMIDNGGSRQCCPLIHTHQSHHYVLKQCRVGGECCQSSPAGKSF